MPPERFPWERKDLRKHLRSTPRWREPSSNQYGSKYDKPIPRWRESSSSHYGSYRDFSRWGGSNEFRRPPGHGKQGGWHMFAEESGNGYAPFRSSDRVLDDKNFRPTVARGDGKYGRNSRDRTSFVQRDWRAHSWDMSNGSPNMPGRLHDLNNNQRSVDDMLTYSTSQAHPEFSSTWGQLQPEEQHVDNKLDGVSVLEEGQRGDREASLEWKPLKWTRSISLSSRGSGFSNSSSSKSLGGADSNEGKVELHVKNAPVVTSSSGDATACVISDLFEEMSAKKKSRLNWGEGLAKYEKKKVDGPEVHVDKDGAVISGRDNEAIHSECLNLVDNSPRVIGLSECASPATPSSVACSSLGPGEKSFSKAVNVDNDAINLCGSPSTGSQSHTESFAFNLEVLDGTSVTNLLAELLHFDDSTVDSSFVRSTVMNKLLILKDNISKTLEVTESEIDSLENELKSLKCDSGSRCPCPEASRSLPVEYNAKDCSDLVVASTNIPRPSPLQVLSCVDGHVEDVPVCNNVLNEVNCGIKNGGVDSPETPTSKFFEPVSAAKALCSPCGPVKLDECSGDTNVEGSGVSSCRDVNMLIESKEGASVSNILTHAEDNLRNMILVANKESACGASEVFNCLLPRDQCKIDFYGISSVALLKDDAMVREKFAWRKRLMKFKERVVTVKFKAFHHLWKEDMRLLAIRKNRTKSQKKYESSLRITQCVIQKNRPSIRLRFSSPVGNLSSVPTTEMLNFTSKLLSESQAKRCRNDLKMPALILDKKERRNLQFISRNGLVEDPWAVEKERAMINPWTSEEREIFIEKLATFGKDFQKIASYLDHKTTADCVEFYYKNHKSDCFEKTKKSKQGKSSTNYLVASGNNWKREMNTASLDILGAASFIAAEARNDTEKQQMHAGSAGFHGDGNLDQSSDYDMLENERETVAADILAGISGTISSEAVGSSITTSLDLVEGYQKVNSVKKRPSICDVSQTVDEETCSDDSCGEMDPVDWTDEEKCIFVQAVSCYGKDFAMIAQCVGTRSREQCKVFFSKARKCLGLDSVHTGLGNSEDANGGGSSDTEDGCGLETSSVLCNKLSLETARDLHLPASVRKLEDNGDLSKETLTSDLNKDEKTSDSCITENKFNSPLDCGSKIINHQSEFAQAQEISNESISSEARREKSSEDGISAGRAINISEAGYCSSNSDAFRVKEEVCAYGSGDCLEGEKLFFAGSSLNGQMNDDYDATRVMPLEDKLSAESFLHSSAVPCNQNQLGSLENGDTGKKSVDHLQVESFSNSGESSHVLRGYPLQVEAKKEEMNREISCGSVFELKGGLSVCESNSANQFLSQDGTLQKCSITKKQVNGQSSDSVKLFGKILSKPPSPFLPKTNPLENVENCVNNKLGSKSLLSSNVLKFDQDNVLALENVPVKSYGFWDGSKIHAGFSSIPDYFLSKYPEAFGNYHRWSSKTGAAASAAAVKCSSDPSLSNVSILSAGERDYHMQQPYSKQRQNVFSEIQRNGFDGITTNMNMNIQQQVVSDPVAALKLHYEQQQQYGGQNGRSIDDSWNLGR